MKYKKRITSGVAALVILLVLFFVVRNELPGEKVHTVQRGRLETVVSSVGEVSGERAVEINLPTDLDRRLRIWSVKIADLVQEGKQVRKGDYIATLDDSELRNRMRERLQDKERFDADLRNAKLDSMVVLSRKRQDITNALLDLEYQKIDLEQSKYESEAYQRRAQMNFDKAVLALDRRKRDYQLDQSRIRVRMRRIENRVAELDDLLQRYEQAIASMRITSPDDGIVMFAKDFRGKTYGKDSEISLWRPLVATLPDMSVAINETFVREIDIARISIGDSVSITVDALPGRRFSGRVVHIATIGEDHRNFDMRVFRVVIRFDESHPDLKPGMTASNTIVTGSATNMLLVPLEAINREGEKSFVYLRTGTGTERREVETGMENEQAVVIISGLDEGDRVILQRSGV